MTSVDKRRSSRKSSGHRKHSDGGFSDTSSGGSFLDETDREVSNLTDRAFRSLCIGDEAVYNDSDLSLSSPSTHSDRQLAFCRNSEEREREDPKRTAQENFNLSVQQYGQDWITGGMYGAEIHRDAQWEAYGERTQRMVSATFQHSLLETSQLGKSLREEELSFLSNGATELSSQQRRSHSRVSSLIRAFNSDGQRDGVGMDDKIRERDDGTSWDKSALMSIQRELSEFSYQQNFNHHFHPAGAFSCRDANFYSSEAETMAQISHSYMRSSQTKHSMSAQVNCSSNFFIHSEFSPFKLWRDYNRFAFQQAEASGFMHYSEFPKWYQTPMYNELSPENQSHSHHRDIGHPRNHLGYPVPLTAPRSISTSSQLQRASAVEKRCESELAVHHPHRKWTQSLATNKLPPHRPSTASPSAEMSRHVRDTISSVKALQQKVKMMSEHDMTNQQEVFCKNESWIHPGNNALMVKTNVVSSNKANPFRIGQLLTSSVHQHQDIETSRLHQHEVSPQPVEHPPVRAESRGATPDVRMSSYRSRATSLLFNLKDNRKRVKSTYSPTKFKGLDTSEKKQQPSIKESHETAFTGSEVQGLQPEAPRRTNTAVNQYHTPGLSLTTQTSHPARVNTRQYPENTASDYQTAQMQGQMGYGSGFNGFMTSNYSNDQLVGNGQNPNTNFASFSPHRQDTYRSAEEIKQSYSAVDTASLSIDSNRHKEHLIDKDLNQIDTKKSLTAKTEPVAQTAKEHQRRVAQLEQQMKVAHEEQQRRATEEQQRGGVEEQQRRVAQLEQQRRIAEEEQQRKAAHEEQQRKAVEEQQMRAAQLEQQRKVAHEEQQRRAADEQERRAAQLEQQRRIAEEEQQRKAAHEEQQRKAADEQERRAAQLEQQRKDAHEEQQRKAAEEQQRRAAQLEQQRRIAEEEQERKAAHEEQQRQAADEQERRAAQLEQQRKVAHEEQQRKAAEEQQRRAAQLEQQRRIAEEEQQRKAAHEEQRKAAEEQQMRATQLEQQRRIAEEEQQRKAAHEEQQRKAAEEQQRRTAEEEHKMKAAHEEQQRRAAEQQQRRAAQLEQQTRIVEEEQRRKVAHEEQQERAAEQQQRRAAQLEQQRRIVEEEQQRKAAHEEQQRRAAEQQQMRAAQLEQQRRIAEEEQQRKAAHEEQQRRAADEQRRMAAQLEQQRRIAEEEQRRKVEHEGQQRGEVEEQQLRASQLEQHRRTAEEEQQRKASLEKQHKREAQEQQRRAAQIDLHNRIAEEEQKRKAEHGVQQRRAAEEQQRRNAQLEQQMRLVEDEQRRQDAHKEQQRREAEEQQRGTPKEVQQRKASHEQQQRRAAEEQQRRAGQAEQQRRSRDGPQMKKAAHEEQERRTLQGQQQETEQQQSRALQNEQQRKGTELNQRDSQFEQREEACEQQRKTAKEETQGREVEEQQRRVSQEKKQQKIASLIEEQRQVKQVKEQTVGNTQKETKRKAREGINVIISEKESVKQMQELKMQHQIIEPMNESHVEQEKTISQKKLENENTAAEKEKIMREKKIEKNVKHEHVKAQELMQTKTNNDIQAKKMEDDEQLASLKLKARDLQEMEKRAEQKTDALQYFAITSTNRERKPRDKQLSSPLPLHQQNKKQMELDSPSDLLYHTRPYRPHAAASPAPSLPRSNTSSPALGVKPLMFRVKDNTIRGSSLTKSVKPRFHKNFGEDFLIGSTYDGGLDKTEDDQEIIRRNAGTPLNRAAAISESTALLSPPSSQDYSNSTPHLRPYSRRNTTMDDDESRSVISNMSEDVESFATSAADLTDMHGLFDFDRPESACSFSSDVSRSLGKPPAVPPKSEKALRRAQRLTSRRIKKELSKAAEGSRAGVGKEVSSCPSSSSSNEVCSSNHYAVASPHFSPPVAFAYAPAVGSSLPSSHKDHKSSHRSFHAFPHATGPISIPSSSPHSGSAVSLHASSPASKPTALQTVAHVSSSSTLHHVNHPATPVTQYHVESSTYPQSYPLTQRKVLQDLGSGQYFVVDVPVQVKTKTFFDPETGKYVQLNVRQTGQNISQPKLQQTYQQPQVQPQMQVKQQQQSLSSVASIASKPFRFYQGYHSSPQNYQAAVVNSVHGSSSSVPATLHQNQQVSRENHSCGNPAPEVDQNSEEHRYSPEKTPYMDTVNDITKTYNMMNSTQDSCNPFLECDSNSQLSRSSVCENDHSATSDYQPRDIIAISELEDFMEVSDW
ncbi:cardiac-enriched FHL2-interacting protein [Anableps anableps]